MGLKPQQGGSCGEAEAGEEAAVRNIEGRGHLTGDLGTPLWTPARPRPPHDCTWEPKCPKTSRLGHRWTEVIPRGKLSPGQACVRSPVCRTAQPARHMTATWGTGDHSHPLPLPARRQKGCSGSARSLLYSKPGLEPKSARLQRPCCLHWVTLHPTLPLALKSRTRHIDK